MHEAKSCSVFERCIHVLMILCGICLFVAFQPVHAFEQSRHIDPTLFNEPPKAYRQHAWLTYDLLRATEQNMTRQVERWAQNDLTGGFYLGMGGGNTLELSQAYLEGAGIRPSERGIGFLSDAYFLPDYTPEMVQAIMQETIPVWDVTIKESMWPVKIGPSYDGALTYLHKVKDGRHIYFFANSSDKSVDTQVQLRGSVDVSQWNPVNGQIEALDETHESGESEVPVTTVGLKLAPTSAVFLVEESGETL